MYRALLLTVVAIVGLASARNAQAANVRADFSTASNPNGAWSYAAFDSNSLALFESNVMTPGGIGGHVLSWWHPDFSDYPNVSISEITPEGFLSIHPSDGLRSAVGYEAFADGLYHFVGEFRALDSDAWGTTTDFHIQAPDSSTIAAGNLSYYGGPSSHAFSFARPLLAGQTVVFSVGSGGDNQHYDNTGLRLVVTNSVVPEPAAGLLLTMVLATMAAQRRR